MSTLLTTLSILNNRNNIAYYSTEIKEKKYYGTGISQQEIGTKYFLSDPDANIDRIVVIGSEETYSNGDQKKTEDLKADYEKLKESFSGSDSSALEFYSYRIAEFLNGRSDEEKKNDSDINDVRKKELQDILSDYLNEHNVQNYETGFQQFQKLNYKKKDEASDPEKLYFGEIRSLIQKDIKENFVKAEDYEKYLKSETFPEFEVFRNNPLNLENIAAGIEEIQKNLNKNKSNKTIENEAYAAAAESLLEQVRGTLEEQKIHSNEELYEKVLDQIHITTHKLIEQIHSMKSSRLNQETNYVKYYLYESLSSDNKLQPVVSDRKIALEFVPLKTRKNNKEEENLTGIVNAIIKDGKQDLYIDMQGGSRTDGYVRNAVLSILNNEDSRRIEICRIVATDFSPVNFVNPIVDETKRYQITDLVSGMNAFIQYGRADLIEKYVREANIKEKNTIQLVNQMVLIDHSLSVCNIEDLIRSIRGLRDIFKNKNDKEEDMIFEILEEGIRSDYQELLDSKDGDYISLAKWALRKNFIQQAMTIVEAKMPEELVRRGILYYAKDEDELTYSRNVVNQQKQINGNDKQAQNQMEDINRFFIKYYFCYNKKDDVYDYIPDSTGDFIDFGENDGPQDAAIRYLYENDGKCEGCLHVYTKMNSIQGAIQVRNKYMKFATARNELNHASVNIKNLCGVLGVRYVPENKKTAYDIISECLHNFLQWYTGIAQKYPLGENDVRFIGKKKKHKKSKKKKKNLQSDPNPATEKSKPVKPETNKPTGHILQMFPDAKRGIIASREEEGGVISFSKKDMDPDTFDQLSRGDEVEYERVMTSDSLKKEMKAVNVRILR